MASHDFITPNRITLETTAKEGKRLWLGCSDCGRNVFVSVEDFCNTSGISILTPLKARLRCTGRGSRNCFCTVEPYSGPVSRRT